MVLMHLRYETGIATLIQFIIAVALSFITGLTSIIGSCTTGNNPVCVGNTLVSLVLIILIVFAFGAVLVLGYAAQERRSSRLAIILMIIEACAALGYIFDAQHTSNIIDRLSDLLIFLVIVWVILITWRLATSKGGRIVKNHRRRRVNRPN